MMLLRAESIHPANVQFIHRRSCRNIFREAAETRAAAVCTVSSIRFTVELMREAIALHPFRGRERGAAEARFAPTQSLETFGSSIVVDGVEKKFLEPVEFAAKKFFSEKTKRKITA